MSHDAHRDVLATLREQLDVNKCERHSIMLHLRDAARNAHSDGLSVAEIARCIACSRYYTHTLIHGRKDRPERKP